METFTPAEMKFSESAIKHFSNSLKKRGKGSGIKLGVKEAGCSGYEYTFNFVDEINTNDIHLNENGCDIYVDPSSYEFLKGSMVDYVEDGLNKGIKFINPNAKAVCGCGESFTV